jgi:hypothetical protein
MSTSMIRRLRKVHQIAIAFVSAAVCAGGVLLPAEAPVASANTASASTATANTTTSTSSLGHSRELWATVDVCDPADQRDTIGIRGSMPGDGNAHDTMYMDFQLQYLQGKNTWVDLAHGGSSGLIAVGPGKTVRQGGTSFQLMPVKGKPAYTMRGFVTFQWRQNGKVLHEVTRATSAGHQGVADADPPGFSAAECTIA